MPPTDLAEWRQVVSAKANPDGQVDIAMVGKYVQIRDSYMSLNEALMHGGLKSRTRVNIHYIESTDIEQHGTHALEGHGCDPRARRFRRARHRGQDPGGALRARAARAVPRHLPRHAGRDRRVRRAMCSGSTDANSTEFNRATPHPVIALISEWQDQARGVQKRDEASAKARTMRLGAQEVLLGAGTRARDIFGKDIIMERHRHRYEFNNNYLDRFTHGGPALLGLLAGQARGDHRAARAIRGSSPRSSTRNSPRRRAMATRCSRGSCARRARIAQRSCRKRPGHEARRAFEVGIDRPFFLIAGPCVIEGPTLDAGDRRTR